MRRCLTGFMSAGVMGKVRYKSEVGDFEEAVGIVENKKTNQEKKVYWVCDGTLNLQYSQTENNADCRVQLHAHE